MGLRGSHARRAWGVAAIAALLAAVASSDAQAQAYRVRNLGPSAFPVYSSNPREFFEHDGLVYFEAQEAQHGVELWRTDGTPAGTTRLEDLNPGAARSFAESFASLGSQLLFVAQTDSTGAEAWSTDGSVGGARLVTDLEVGPGSGAWWYPVELGGAVYFAGQDAVRGEELFRTDGTAGGTALVKDVRPGPDSSFIGFMVNLGGVLVFDADDGSNGFELWRSDGTSGGTTLLKDVEPGPAGARIDYPEKLGGVLYLPLEDDASGLELWRIDGTEAGTMRVADIEPGPGGSAPGSGFWGEEWNGIAALGGVLYFAATTTSQGRELWRSDGTQAGTWIVKDIVPGSAGSEPDEPVAVGSEIFFRACTPAEGCELWKSDGTEAGTTLVADIEPGPSHSFPAALVELGGRAYFAPAAGAADGELWTSDGTAAGTSRVIDIEPSPGSDGLPCSSSVIVRRAGRLYFGGRTDGAGCEPWVSDGTAAGTQPLLDVDPLRVDSSILGLTDASTRVYALAAGESEALPYGLWASDGTEAGTIRLLSLARPTAIAPTSAGGAFFVGDGFDEYLWYTGGTVAGTRMVTTTVFEVGRNGGGPVTRDDLAFFRGRGRDGSGAELWRSDGTIFGTARVKDIVPGPGGSMPTRLVTTSLGVLFLATTAAQGREPWLSDGTEAGTRLLADMNPGPGGTSLVLPVERGGIVYFIGGDARLGMELYRTDGTEAGTRLVRDVNPGPGSAFAAGPPEAIPPVATSDAIVFVADDGSRGAELWRSDGTEAGTALVADILAGPGSSEPRQLVALGDVVYFSASDGVTGYELWRSDGTAIGTWQVKDIYPGWQGSNVRSMVALPDRCEIAFVATDGDSGVEVWLSDGTETGTRPADDIAPGSAHANPDLLTLSGERLYLAADADGGGSAMWALPVAPAPPLPPYAVMAAQGPLVGTDVDRVTRAEPGAVVTWSVTYQNTECRDVTMRFMEAPWHPECLLDGLSDFDTQGLSDETAPPWALLLEDTNADASCAEAVLEAGGGRISCDATQQFLDIQDVVVPQRSSVELRFRTRLDATLPDGLSACHWGHFVRQGSLDLLASTAPPAAVEPSCRCVVAGPVRRMELAKTVSATCADPGSEVTFRLDVSNPGLQVIDAWTLTDALDPAFTDVVADPPLVVSGLLVQLNGSALAPGETRTYTYRATLPCTPSGVSSYRATLAWDTGVAAAEAGVAWGWPDIRASTLSVAWNDLDADGCAEAGEPVALTVEVRNAGSCPARDVLVTSDLQRDVDAASIVALQGGTVDGSTVSWDSAGHAPLLSIAAGGSVRLEVQLMLSPLASFPIAFAAHVEARGHGSAGCPAPGEVASDPSAFLTCPIVDTFSDLLRNASVTSLAAALGELRSTVFTGDTPNARECGVARLDRVGDVLVPAVDADLPSGVVIAGGAAPGSPVLVFYDVSEWCTRLEGGTRDPLCVTRQGDDVVVRAAPDPARCR
jgi:uncharacterized repeat protein (TIGR01451 family)